MVEEMQFVKSLEHLEKVKQFIPVGSQTFSKGWRYFPVGASPLFIERGEGCYVWDMDGNRYIDLIMGLGPITLGYCYPAVDNAIRYQLDKGTIFSLPSPLEYEMSELLSRIIPCAEMVRFSKTGSEVCQAAVRIARAYTGRTLIL